MGLSESRSFNLSYSQKDINPFTNLIEIQRKKNFCFSNISKEPKIIQSQGICSYCDPFIEYFKYNVIINFLF